MSKKLTYDRLTAGDFNRMPCFLAGTLINTEKGLMVIENIKPDDKVWSYNLKTDCLELENVLETYVNKAEAYLVLETEYGDKFQVTGTHRFWMPIDQRWKSASELSLGDCLFDAKTQTSINIKRIEKIEKDVKTYNLNVNKNHNYTIGEQHILTHNKTKSSKLHRKYIFEIYTFTPYMGEVQHVGLISSGQDTTSRMSQHISEAEQKWEGQLWKIKGTISLASIEEVIRGNKDEDGFYRLIEDGDIILNFNTGNEGVEMTYMEAFLFQQYFISHYRNVLKEQDKGYLFVNADIVNEIQFNRYIELGGKDICRFIN